MMEMKKSNFILLMLMSFLAGAVILSAILISSSGPSANPLPSNTPMVIQNG